VEGYGSRVTGLGFTVQDLWFTALDCGSAFAAYIVHSINAERSVDRLVGGASANTPPQEV
jgi:hypothetical protein